MINLHGKCSKRELKDILEGVIKGLDSDETVEYSIHVRGEGEKGHTPFFGDMFEDMFGSKFEDMFAGKGKCR